MLVHNHHHSAQHLRPRSGYSIYSAKNQMNKLTFRKRLTQQLNRLLFPCHPESDNHHSTTTSISTINANTTPTILATSSSSSIATISSINSSSRTIQEEQTDQTDFFENDEHVIVHELNRLPSLKPPPRPTKRSRGKNNKQTRSFESVLSQSTLTTIRTSHFDNMSEYIFGDHMSNTTSLSGDEEIDDEDVFRPQVALSVAILPSVVAAATAARSRRYQARVARATQT